MENQKLEIAQMLLRYYNLQAETSCRINNNDEKINLVYNAYVACGENAELTREAIKNYVSKNPIKNKEVGKDRDKEVKVAFNDCFNSIIEEKGEAQPTQPQQDEAPAPQPAQPAQSVQPANVNGAMDILSQAVSNILAQTHVERIENDIMAGVEAKIQNFIKEEYGTIERKITTVVDGKPREMKGIQHEMFETVLKFVANDEPVYLTGRAGTGKNVLCKQVAEALGLDFYFTNAVTQEYKLTGFTDAMGTYQPTQFYKAFTEGGVFMLDEMDASIPEALITLNSAIANRYFDFPAPIGYVEAHPDFRVIGAGNTLGHGADIEYCGRNQLDGASLDRFAVVEIDYCEAIENSVAGDIELADFCRDYRQSAHNAGVQVIVSYRAIGRLAKMMQLLSIEEALSTCLVKGLDIDDLNIIIAGLKRDNKYKTALKNLAKAG